MQQMACTLPWRIISASDRPSSAVLMAPASVTSIWPPLVEVPHVGIRRIDERRGVEMPVVMVDEIARLRPSDTFRRLGARRKREE